MPTFVHNKKAHFDYEMIEKFDAGIELLGHEVKSVKSSHGSLEGARVLVRGGEAFLVGASIPLYQPNNAVSAYQTDRTRKLLLTKKEIAQIARAEGQKGLTIIPISMFGKGKKIKVGIAIVRGKKKYDKRETIKKRDTERDIAREWKAR
ncbi:MAG: SsrA-binding protein SmpB [Candidatus Paceibacterota bacterium]|nr:SsrA-binding protein SmpB [Candidatus Paceibacterota bacterium]